MSGQQQVYRTSQSALAGQSTVQSLFVVKANKPEDVHLIKNEFARVFESLGIVVDWAIISESNQFGFIASKPQFDQALNNIRPSAKSLICSFQQPYNQFFDGMFSVSWASPDKHRKLLIQQLPNFLGRCSLIQVESPLTSNNAIVVRGPNGSIKPGTKIGDFKAALRAFGLKVSVERLNNTSESPKFLVINLSPEMPFNTAKDKISSLAATNGWHLTRIVNVPTGKLQSIKIQSPDAHVISGLSTAIPSLNIGQVMPKLVKPAKPARSGEYIVSCKPMDDQDAIIRSIQSLQNIDNIPEADRVRFARPDDLNIYFLPQAKSEQLTNVFRIKCSPAMADVICRHVEGVQSIVGTNSVGGRIAARASNQVFRAIS